MRATTYTTAALLALSLAACNNGEITPTPDTRVALQVTSGIQTRAYDATWEAGDEIGIFGFTQGDAPAQTHANAQYVTTNGNGSFIPAQEMNTIYLPADNTPLDFVAYYPYTAGLKNNIYTVDVTDQSDQSAIDLMAAGKQSADRISVKVSFNFVHKLSKIVINLAPGMGVTGDELEGMTVQLTGQKTAATFDVTQPDGTVSITDPDQSVTLTLKANAEGTFAEGILLPNENFDGMTLHLRLADGGFFNWTLNNSTEATQFKAGHKYTYNITVNRTNLYVTSTISDWAPGNGEDGENGDAY